MLNYLHIVINVLALRSDCLKDLSVNIDCKLNFHRHHHDFLFLTSNEIARVNLNCHIFHFHHR
jgi:hypothetical protein